MFNFIVQIWDTIPKPVQYVILLLIIISIFLGINKKYKFIRLIRNFLLDLYNFLKVKIYGRKEIKRLEILINWKYKRDYEIGEFAYDGIKVKNVFKEEEENVFVDATKKTSVLVLKQVVKEEDKSENLAKSVSQSIIYGYIGTVKHHLTGDLSMAINNIEIIEKLTSMRDYKAQKMFISKMITNEEIKKLMDKLYEIKMEGIYKHIFIPYVLRLTQFSISKSEEIQKDVLKLLEWFCDYQKRLKEVFKSKYFPKTSFLYVRMPTKPLIAHMRRAVDNFENQDCSVQIVSGWKKDKVSINKVSKALSKTYNYPLMKEFNGKVEKKDKIEERIAKVHKKADFEIKL